VNRAPTAKEVLQDIEFELIQGAISRDELGQGIHVARQYQNKLRSEAFQSSLGMREVLSRLFQLNDMLITLLQETTTALQSLRLELRQSARLAHAAPPTATAATTASDCNLPPAVAMSLPAGWDEGATGPLPTEIEDAMQAETLLIELNLRSTDRPIIGGLLRRLRATFHHLVLFYVNLLARKQMEVNQTYGEWILRLVQQQQQQQEQIEWLSAQVTILTEGEGVAPPPADLQGY